jgi:hypothetical protein
MLRSIFDVIYWGIILKSVFDVIYWGIIFIFSFLLTKEVRPLTRLRATVISVCST